MKNKGTGKSERYVSLRYWMLQSPAWQSLPGGARALYIEMAQRYNGSNNGRIPYSVREAVHRSTSAIILEAIGSVSCRIAALSFAPSAGRLASRRRKRRASGCSRSTPATIRPRTPPRISCAGSRPKASTPTPSTDSHRTIENLKHGGPSRTVRRPQPNRTEAPAEPRRRKMPRMEAPAVP
jgi:hypothetical protein